MLFFPSFNWPSRAAIYGHFSLVCHMTLPTKRNWILISVTAIPAEINPWPLFLQDKQAQHLRSLHLGHVLLALSVSVTLCWASFRFSTLLLNWESQNWAQYNQSYLFEYVQLPYGVPALLHHCWLPFSLPICAGTHRCLGACCAHARKGLRTSAFPSLSSLGHLPQRLAKPDIYTILGFREVDFCAGCSSAEIPPITYLLHRQGHE